MKSSVDFELSELTDMLATWRNATIDVASRGVPPHVSLLYPWIEPPIAPLKLNALDALAARIPALDLTLGRVEAFENGTVFLSIVEEWEVKRICREIWQAFPECRPYEGEISEPRPHVTVAKSVATDQSVHMRISEELGPLLPFRVRANAFSVMVEDSSGEWRVYHKSRMANA